MTSQGSSQSDSDSGPEVVPRQGAAPRQESEPGVPQAWSRSSQPQSQPQPRRFQQDAASEGAQQPREPQDAQEPSQLPQPQEPQVSRRPFWPDHSPAFLKLRRAVRAMRAEQSAQVVPAAPRNPDAPVASDLPESSKTPQTPKNPESRILIGLSGGADSLGLVAAALAEGWDVLALCVDHGLQPDSAAVAARAVATARDLGATARSVKVQVKPGNVEARAREARYEALMAVAAAEGRSVWVAHTMDDQAETYLLGSLRGRAVGMPVVGAVIRPFLRVRRADTVAACTELGLDVWHDPMNTDPRFRRVRVRTELLPLLADIHGGDPVPPLAAAASLARDDAAALDMQVVATAQVAEIVGLPVALRRRTYLALVDAPLGPRHLDAIDSLVMDWHGQGPVSVVGFRVWRQGPELRVSS